ncbi:hypothetical protein [Streptomyces sp900116325]|uniref:hypothetical protein n=1 Tax=Streptomyces sp. 900116325 TaxID=3154295 RepID=UPI0033ADCF08
MTSRPIPEHGTEGRYQGTRTRPGCRCKTCLNGWAKAHQKRALAHLEGRPPKIPAGPITAHIALLYASDMTTGQIAHAAKVSPSTIKDHAAGAFPTIRRTTGEKILAVAPFRPSAIGFVPALGTIRRLRALYAAGHSSHDISAAHPTLQIRSVEYIVGGTRSLVSVTNRGAVVSAYRLLATRKGTSARSLNRAAAGDWAGPEYWDEEDFDNPNFEPAVRVTAKASEVLAEDAAWLIEHGLDRDLAAKRIGKSRFYIDRALREAAAAEAA